MFKVPLTSITALFIIIQNGFNKSNIFINMRVSAKCFIYLCACIIINFKAEKYFARLFLFTGSFKLYKQSKLR